MKSDLDAVEAYLLLRRDALAGRRIGRITMEASLEDDRIRRPISDYFVHVRTRLGEALSDLDVGIEPEALADLAIAAVQGGFVVARATGQPDTERTPPPLSLL